MAAKFAVVFKVLLDDTCTFHFTEEDYYLPMFSMAALGAWRSLNWYHEYFKQTVPFFSIDEFQSLPYEKDHFCNVCEEGKGHRSASCGKPIWKAT